MKNERFSEDGLIEEGVMHSDIRSKKMKATRAEVTFPDERKEDDLKEGKTARVKVGPNDGGAATAVVVSASSGVSSGKVNVARAHMKPIYGGSKRSRISAPEGVSEEDWVTMSNEQRSRWRKRHTRRM